MQNDDFETLLKRKQYMDEIKPNEKEILPANSKASIQKADKSATLFDFIKMLDKLISLTMKDVTFIPDEGKVMSLDAMKDFTCPFITYKVNSRESKTELKPRVRETIIENEDKEDEQLGEIWGQKFKCEVQFNIFASVYVQAEEVMNNFEDLMTSYAGFFKKNGIAEIYFKKQFTDDSYMNLRETLSIRNICYYVEIEKLTVIYREKIKEIELLAQKEEK